MTSFFHKVVIPEELAARRVRGSVVSEENNHGKNRFPTTALGNDNNNNDKLLI